MQYTLTFTGGANDMAFLAKLMLSLQAQDGAETSGPTRRVDIAPTTPSPAIIDDDEDLVTVPLAAAPARPRGRPPATKKADAVPAAPAPAPAAPVSAPAPVAAPAPAPAAAETPPAVDDPRVTEEGFNDFLATAIGKLGPNPIVSTMGKYKAKRKSEVKVTDRPAFVAEISALLDEHAAKSALL